MSMEFRKRNEFVNFKLYLYSELKHRINTEAYLMIEKSLKNRQLLTKFRLCDHCLLIETGIDIRKYLNKDLKCTFCNDIDVEFHFCLDCNLNVQPRNNAVFTFIKESLEIER